MSGTGWSSRHSPIGAISTSLSTRCGLVAAISAATIPPNEWPTTVACSMPSVVEQLVVVEDEVPEVLDVLEALRVAGAGVLGGDDAVAGGQGVEQRVPEQAAGAVDVEQRVAGPGLAARGS